MNLTDYFIFFSWTLLKKYYFKGGVRILEITVTTFHECYCLMSYLIVCAGLQRGEKMGKNVRMWKVLVIINIGVLLLIMFTWPRNSPIQINILTECYIQILHVAENKKQVSILKQCLLEYDLCFMVPNISHSSDNCPKSKRIFQKLIVPHLESEKVISQLKQPINDYTDTVSRSVSVILDPSTLWALFFGGLILLPLVFLIWSL